METKKKDLEIIYNLQWKNKSTNGGDKANIIGMYDIPATTLNWEIFKSYLLKNSGTVGDDVKVCYITDSNREFPIESQTDFQIALYAFRRKARMGDVVNLKLDRISDQPTYKNSRHSNDVETQYDEAPSIVSTCCNFESPPEWFVSYMTELKKNMREEVTKTVSAIILDVKRNVGPPACCNHTRKCKADNSRKIRRLPHHHQANEAFNETREIIRSLKIEGKLERKLEKLENKTKKIREKKLALFTKSSDGEAGPSTSSSRSNPPVETEREDELLPLDATPTQTQNDIPRFLGGEVYSHSWEVKNSGKLQWDNDTQLVYTWGSKELESLNKTIPAPHLKPGEVGIVSALLRIPTRSGDYECYFHFHHNGRRFGQWLGCQIKVNNDNFSCEETRFTFLSRMLQDLSRSKECERKYDNFLEGNTQSEVIRDIGSRVAEVKLQDPIDNNCSSDSDNQSIISVPETSSSKDMKEDYIMVPIPECFKIDGLTAANSACSTGTTLVADDCAKKSEIDDEACSTSSRKSDIVIVTLPENNEDDEEYALVLVDGQKVSIPKKIIKAEYLQTVEQSKKSSSKTSRPDSADGATMKGLVTSFGSDEFPGHCSPVLPVGEQAPKGETNNDFSSHCSAAGSCFSDVNYSAMRKQLEDAFGPTTTEEYLSSIAGAPPLNLSTHDRKSDETTGNRKDFDKLRCLSSSSANPTALGTQTVSTPDKFDFLAPNPRRIWHENFTYIPEEDVVPVFSTVSEQAQDLLPTTNRPKVTFESEERVTPLGFKMTYNNVPYVAEFDTNHVVKVAAENPTATGVRFSVGADTVGEPAVPEAAAVLESVPEEMTRDFEGAGNMASAVPESSDIRYVAPEADRPSDAVQTVHILPETLVNGAVTVASTALHTARSVFNRITQEQPGRWINGHWVSSSPATPREANLQALAEMGFWNRDLNATLLARYNDDLSRVVAELVQ